MTKKILSTIAILIFSSNISAQTYNFDVPSDDRWFYPFNFQSGSNLTGSTFSTVGTAQFFFNDRDGMVYIAWDTSTEITTGMGVENYEICAIKVTLTNIPNAIWEVDLTYDEWYQTDHNDSGVINDDGIPRGEPGDMDGESDDPDPGRPVELTGLAFGPFSNESTWAENSIYSGGGQFPPQGARDPYGFVFQDGINEKLHIEDHVTGLHNSGIPNPVTSFTVVPWAIGVPIDYTPGNQNVPFDVEFEVDLTLSEGAVLDYFQQQLNNGRLMVAISSLTDTFQQAPEDSIPKFYMKESLNDPTAPAGALPARLEIVLGGSVKGDGDGDGIVESEDYPFMADCFTGPLDIYSDNCCSQFDFNDDMHVDMKDYAMFTTSIAD